MPNEFKNTVRCCPGRGRCGHVLDGGASRTARADEGKVKCEGVNSCKGQSACKSANNACKGQNSCKGKGFMEMTKAECDAAKAKTAQVIARGPGAA